MSETKLDDAYIKIIKDPQVYQGDLEESVRFILRECATALAVSRVSLWLISEDQSELTCLSLYSSIDDEFESGEIVKTKHVPNYFEALLNTRFIDASDTYNDSRLKEILDSYIKPMDVRSLLDVTVSQLQHDGLPQGVLCNRMIGEQRNWTTSEIFFVASIADLLSQRLISNQLDQTEDKYQALYESATDGILIFGGEKIMDANPAACAMFGGSKDELLDVFPIELSPKYQPDGQDSLSKIKKHVMTCRSGIPQHFEWRHLRFDGSEFDAESTISIIKILGKSTLIALIRDVTAKKQETRLKTKNHQLEIAKKEAEETSKAKMNFLANMSHEIRTPMNGIFGMVSLALDTPLNIQQKDYIETIQSSTESLLTILNDVLEYSKLSDTKFKLNYRAFNPRHLVTDVIRTFEVLASNKGLIIDFIVNPDIPLMLFGDDHRIRQVLINLVGNAVKFTGKGTVNLKISYINDQDDESRQCVRFAVSDTGVGIDNLVIDKLFQPFSQADSSITRNYGGTGLGLAICRDLVYAMGGEINVETQLGKGSTFYFDIYLQQPKQESKKIMATPSKGKGTVSDTAKDQTFPNKPILVVEDHFINQKVTTLILEKLGYPVTMASNGQEAVTLCKKNDYSIILMDLSMPEMDGFEATEKIRSAEKKGSRATIIAVTGHTFLEHRERCEEVGIDDFLSKPYDLFKLKEKLDFHSKDT